MTGVQTCALPISQASASTSLSLASTAATTQTNEATLAVADAQVAVTNVVTPVLQSQLDAVKAVENTIQATTATQSAIDTAQTKIDEATAAAQLAETKKTQAETYQQAAGANTTVESAQATVTSQTSVLTAAETAVDTQTVVVVNAQASKDEAQVVVDAATQQGLKVEVYSVAGQNNAPTLPANATPILTAIDTNGINEAWGSGNVAGSNRNDDVIVKYSGTWTPQYTGTQYIYTPADDGTKLYLDGTLVSNAWYDKGGGGPTIDVPTVSGVGKALDRKSTRLNSSHIPLSRMPSSA